MNVKLGLFLWSLFACAQAYAQSYELLAEQSKLCVDMQWGVTTAGAPIIQWECHHGDNQIYIFKNVGSGNYTIQAKHSGLCLQASSRKTSITQQSCSSSNAQRFQLMQRSNGNVSIKSASTGLCFGVKAQSLSAAALVVQQSCADVNYKRFFLRAPGSNATSAQTAPAPVSCSFNGQTVASGGSVNAYQASSVVSPNVCASQSRVCSNGVLSGSYSFASCSVQAAPTPAPSPTSFTLGQRPFSAASSWNKAIPSTASYTRLSWPASTGYNYGVAWDSYSPSVYISKSTDPEVSVSMDANWGWPAGVVKVRVPAGVTGANGTDGELVVIDGTTVHNFWQFKRTGTNSASTSAYGSTDILTGSGWGSRSPFKSAGIVATGSSQLAGLVVQAETDAGEIQHALQITLDFALQRPGSVGEAISGDGGNNSGISVEGERLAIPKDTAMPSGLSPLGQKVFRALQNYGAYNIDVSGGTSNLRAQANAYDDATIMGLQKDVLKILPLLQKVSF